MTTKVDPVELALIGARKFNDLKTAYLELVKAYHLMANLNQPEHHITLSIYNCEEKTCKIFMLRLEGIEND